MSSKTKIVVLHMKEVVYTAVFLLLALVLGILVFFMFGSGKSASVDTSASGKYTAGVYRTAVELNDNTFDVEVTVDTNKIKSIRLNNLSESTAAMFPLMEPALESLASQIYTQQSLENIQYASDQKYTSLMLLNAIETALSKAESHTGS